jgi:hypothetical protein
MAAANESQGLKIAVAAFMSVSVILTVTSYLLYANLAAAQARSEVARDAHRDARHAADLAVKQYEGLRTRIGTKAVDFDAATDEISASFKKVDERLDKVLDAMNAAVQTAQQNGAQGPELEDARLKVQKAFASYSSDPNKNYISSLGRLTELTKDLARLTTEVSLKYVDVKKSRASDTRAAKGQKDQGPTTKDQGPRTKD